MTSSTHSDADDLWVITSYFNPVRYRRRLANFRIFRERLHAPLVAVELAYSDDFELTADDADILVQLRGGAVLWQKERLLNVALQSLPQHCRKVAWVDCDVLFAAPDWAEATSRLLDRLPMVQMFERVHYLSPAWTPARQCMGDVEFSRPSAAFSIASGLPPASSLGHSSDARQGTSATGFAWAARRELLDEHGLFDACILGGGDRAMACAAANVFDELIQRHYMNSCQRDRYVAWAKPFYEAVRGDTGHLDGDIFHLWHGAVSERRTRSRHEGLQPFHFDPFADIAVAANGSWQWTSQKPQMHDYVSTYFSARREDG